MIMKITIEQIADLIVSFFFQDNKNNHKKKKKNL